MFKDSGDISLYTATFQVCNSGFNIPCREVKVQGLHTFSTYTLNVISIHRSHFPIPLYNRC